MWGASRDIGGSLGYGGGPWGLGGVQGGSIGIWGGEGLHGVDWGWGSGGFIAAHGVLGEGWGSV